jgi:hypothetical protein
MSSKKQLLAQYDLHNVLFNNVLLDISDEESNISIADPMNSVKWLAGHFNMGATELSQYRRHTRTRLSMARSFLHQRGRYSRGLCGA